MNMNPTTSPDGQGLDQLTELIVERRPGTLHDWQITAANVDSCNVVGHFATQDGAINCATKMVCDYIGKYSVTVLDDDNRGMVLDGGLPYPLGAVSDSGRVWGRGRVGGVVAGDTLGIALVLLLGGLLALGIMVF